METGRFKRLIINRNKFDWETLNTPKIKTVFYSYDEEQNDYGTKIRIKCHQRIQREEKTIDGGLCVNWKLIDRFGVRSDLSDTIDYNDGYKKFYDNPNDYLYPYWRWYYTGNGL